MRVPHNLHQSHPQINLPPKGTSWATKESLGFTSKLPAVTGVTRAMMAGSGA